jgi:hypothetical protein
LNPRDADLSVAATGHDDQLIVPFPAVPRGRADRRGSGGRQRYGTAGGKPGFGLGNASVLRIRRLRHRRQRDAGKPDKFSIVPHHFPFPSGATRPRRAWRPANSIFSSSIAGRPFRRLPSCRSLVGLRPDQGIANRLR